MGSDWDEPLIALRWHWGEAYIICHPEPDVWTAQRRDTRETLRDFTPVGLRDQVIRDYTARSVKRGQVASGPADPPDANQCQPGW
jgi:hypothetical protein